MAFIETVSDEDAAGEVTALFERDKERLGYVPNHTRLFAHRPGVYAAWRSLVGAITENMDARRYELVTLAAARRLRSSYCTLAHGKVLLDRFLDASQLRDTAVDHQAAGLDQVEVAVMDFAEKVVDDATAVIPADVAGSASSVSPTGRSWTWCSRQPRGASSRRRSTRFASRPTAPSTTWSRASARR